VGQWGPNCIIRLTVFLRREVELRGCSLYVPRKPFTNRPSCPFQGVLKTLAFIGSNRELGQGGTTNFFET